MKLCVALDREDTKQNLALAKEIKDLDIWLKVGFRSFLQGGPKFLEALKKENENFKIFLDLKLYDIPNTMADAASEISKMGVDMFNVHASSGELAMKTVMERVEKENGTNRPLILAVTALTSFDEDNFQKIYNEPIGIKADKFAVDTFNSGLDGVVCSVYESNSIKGATSQEFLTLTPGIRPANSKSDDQQRVATPQVAKENRVDFIVVGRPIYKSVDPLASAREILSQI